MEGLLRRHGRGKFEEIDDLFGYLAERLAYADGGLWRTTQRTKTCSGS